MTTLTELQEIFDIDFPKVTLDKKQVNLLFKQATQAKSLADQFRTVLTIMTSDFKIDKKTQSDLLKYDYILNLVQVMNKKPVYTTNIDKLENTYSEAINSFRDNKLNSILN
jgi:hypothetical protein